MTTREETIRDYVDRGWVPFAYASDSAPPYDWQHSEVTTTTVPECSTSEYPIGILLGKPSELVVVDIDVQHGGCIDRFIDRYDRELSRTRIVATPSGGYHLYYRFPPDVGYMPKRINAGRWIEGMQGIDLLADGHHVQAPPTIRSGHPTKPDGEYRVIGDNPVAAMPPRLLVDWLESESRRPAIEGDAVDLAPLQDHSWMVELHRAKVRGAAESTPGVRDDTVYRNLCVSVRLAHYLPDDVLTVEQVEADYVEAYEAAQGEEILDIDGKIRRALDLAQSNPWVVESESKSPLPQGITEDRRADYVKKVEDTILARRAREEAERRLAEFAADEVELPLALSGDELSKHASGVQQWVIDQLLAPGQSALLAAQKKSGKTTLVLNLIHSLTTGQPFLGEYRPARPMRVGYFDMELGLVMANSYVEQIGIPREQLVYVDLLGQARMLDTRTDALRNKWARRLRELEVDAIVIDPVSPIASAAGLDENATTGIRQLLDSFNTLARSAGCICGPIVVHHAGHAEAGRGRGSSAFGDWPGAEWNLQKNDPGDPFSTRKFSIQSNRATGGAIHRPRSLDYNPENRRTWYGEKEQPFDPRRATYVELIGSITGTITVKDVLTAVGCSDKTATQWLDNDPHLTVVVDGGRGQGPRTWQKNSYDPFSVN